MVYLQFIGAVVIYLLIDFVIGLFKIYISIPCDIKNVTFIKHQNILIYFCKIKVLIQRDKSPRILHIIRVSKQV